MRSTRLPAAALAALLFMASPARAAESPMAPSAAPPAPAVSGTAPGALALTPDEVEALKFKLLRAKPNLATVSIMSFLAPGSGQAYMGHPDHLLYLWGGYLLCVTAAQGLIPASSVAPTGPKNADLISGGLLIAMATVSGIDAYFVAQGERAGYDQLINRLTDRQASPAAP